MVARDREVPSRLGDGEPVVGLRDLETTPWRLLSFTKLVPACTQTNSPSTSGEQTKPKSAVDPRPWDQAESSEVAARLVIALVRSKANRMNVPVGIKCLPVT